MNPKECKHYLKGGLCSHPAAPKPSHSRCLVRLEQRNENRFWRESRCEVFVKKVT